MRRGPTSAAPSRRSLLAMAPGKSFPSRHTFSAFAIAASWFVASVPVAVVLLVAAGVLAVCRVLGGVHFPRDVVAGALIGSATGALAAFLAALL